ncbi:hypothetical protein EYF80_014561 [Liparis tanakae]|uniref:Uncharacterized protein n=1 Tax=Liparis tanakae TaxID=230148 RepID=A0A4Z2IBR2_9TELE|nr:hypothetical protein EYF80_014561 [Liparis tanakae]
MWTERFLRETSGKMAAIESTGAIIHQTGSTMLHCLLGISVHGRPQHKMEISGTTSTLSDRCGKRVELHEARGLRTANRNRQHKKNGKASQSQPVYEMLLLWRTSDSPGYTPAGMIRKMW